MRRVELEKGTVLRFPNGLSLEILRTIGRGGSSLLYEAKAAGSELYVAIKEVYPADGFYRKNGLIVPVNSRYSLDGLKNVLETREARLSQLASRRNHQVLYVQPPVWHRADIRLPDGRLLRGVRNTYVRMDSLREKGVPLGEYIRQTKEQGKLSLDVVLAVMETVLDAYAALHADKILHGDCQTGNLFLLGGSDLRVGTACIIDFGAARQLLDDGWTAIVEDDIYATDGYCAPELLFREEGFRMSAACDVWSLGYLLLTLLTDRGLDELQRITEYLVLHPAERILRPWEIRALGCTPVQAHLLNELLKTALDDNPQARYPDAGAMREALLKVKRCRALDVSSGVDPYLMWEAACRYRERNAGLFQTEHVPQLVKDLPMKELTVFGSLDGGRDQPAVELLEQLAAGSKKKTTPSENRTFDEFDELDEILELFSGKTSEPTEALFEPAAFDDTDSEPERLEEDILAQFRNELTKKIAEMEQAEFEKPDIEDILSVFHRGETAPEKPSRCSGDHNSNVYLHAPGGAGKSFAAAGLLNRFLESGEKVPLYLDLAWLSSDDIRNTGGEDAIASSLAERYFSSNDPRLARQILTSLSERAEETRYALVLDNLHKVPRSVYREIIRSINRISEAWKSTWLLVIGRANDPLTWDESPDAERLFHPAHTLTLARLRKSVIFQGVQEVWQKKPNPIDPTLPEMVHRYQEGRRKHIWGEDRRRLEEQYDTLGLPLFFMRYLEVFAAGDQLHELPKGTAEILSVYFGQREYDANGRDVHGFLTAHMPWVAYRCLASGRPEFSRQELEAWLQESYGQLCYRSGCMEEFLHHALDNVAVLTPAGNGGFRFVHDCYQEYFSAVAISMQLRRTWETGEIRHLEKINHRWPGHVGRLWPDLCTGELINGRFERMGDVAQLLESLYTCLEENPEKSEKYACYIPYNVSEVVKEAEYYLEKERADWILLGTELGDRYLQADFGHQAWEKQDYQTAVSWYLKAGERGEPLAQKRLGDAYACGHGVEKNLSQSRSWYARAADQGVAAAQVCLGFLFACGCGAEENQTAAVDWFKKAAEKGNLDAAAALGYSFLYGEGVCQDYEQARCWLERAAEKQHIHGCYYLAAVYDEGLGVEPDWQTALRYYRIAASGWHPDALRRVRVEDLRQRKAQGSDPALEEYWYLRGARHEHAGEMYSLGHYYNIKCGDPVQAVGWYRKAAQQGHLAAQASWAYCLLKGAETAPPDYEQVWVLLEDAAKRGVRRAWYHLGKMCEKGLGRKADPQQAAVYYRRAAAELDPRGEEALKHLES